MAALWSNYAIWLPITSALLVQTYKFGWEWYTAGDYDFQVLFRSGGMPSSHTAMVTSLATVVGWREGLGTTSFAIAAVMALFVMYDARGLRQESGKQAQVLNQLVHEFFRGEPISDLHLEELVGHTAKQVFVGAVCGVAFSMLMLWLLGVARAV
jgi:acid phosphatase family membrane protein YuiD